MKIVDACGSVTAWLFSPKYTWPYAEAPDKTDPNWEANDNLQINGTPYRKVEVEPGKWQWQVDEGLQESMRKSERARADLYMALRARVLTDDEFSRAISLGLLLVTRNMVQYYELKKRRELDDAFLQQTRLRAARGDR